MPAVLRVMGALEAAYLAPSLKRYRIALLTPEGNPVLQNWQQVYIVPEGVNADDERAALYLQLLRIIGKSTPP